MGIRSIKHNGRLLALAVTAIATVSMTAGSLSLALFTDQETVDGTFSTGTIVLDDAKIDGLTLTTSNMMPGDVTYDDVVVENDGSSQLRYAVSAASTNTDGKDLRSQLLLQVKVGVTDCSAAGWAADGTAVRTSVALGATTTVFGSAVAGADAGDRNLDAAANETLCFRVELPTATGNDYQSATTTTTFTFDAEQTKNN